MGMEDERLDVVGHDGLIILYAVVDNAWTCQWQTTLSVHKIEIHIPEWFSRPALRHKLHFELTLNQCRNSVRFDGDIYRKQAQVPIVKIKRAKSTCATPTTLDRSCLKLYLSIDCQVLQIVLRAHPALEDAVRNHHPQGHTANWILPNRSDP